MIRRRSLCTLALVLAFLSTPAGAQAEENFNAAVEALSRGADEEALGLLRKVLAEDPSHEQAYELFQRTEQTVWLKLLTKGGDFEVLAKELMERASMGRKQRQNNPDAIRELVKGLSNDNVIERTRVTNQLASDFGEYAVPIMIYSLTSEADEARRLNVMNALLRMGSDVVLPLVEALDSPDAYLRRNLALTLGRIADPRARPALARAAAHDEDPGVRTAAQKALESVGGTGDAGTLFLALGDAYYREDDSVLLPFQYSDVTWHWEGNGLASVDVPRFLYPMEMAKKSYYRALALLPDPGPALAGVARCAVTEIGRLAEWRAAGQEIGDWEQRLQNDDLCAQLAGPEALDLALGWASTQNDWIAAAGLCRLLASTSKTATANLQRAMTASKSDGVQGEAAVALGSIAFRNREGATAETVSNLGKAASREVVRIGAVIDADPARASATASRLSTAFGMSVNPWSTGGRGLGAMKAIPGVDLIVISDRLPDLSTNQVVDELRRDPRTAKVPIFVQTSSPDVDQSSFGGKVTGVLAPDADLGAVEAALTESEGMNRDREEANLLAARAAETLYTLAVGGKTDVSSSADALAGTLASRPDSVVIPALGVLQFMGSAGHVERIVAVLANAERSPEARVRAAHALAEIFSRAGSADEATLNSLKDVAVKDTAFDVRAATASALGRLNLSRDARVELIRSVRGI